MWQGVSLVVDEFTRAAFGEVIIHAILLANFAITRKAQWHKQQVQHSLGQCMETVQYVVPVETARSRRRTSCCTSVTVLQEGRAAQGVTCGSRLPLSVSCGRLDGIAIY